VEILGPLSKPQNTTKKKDTKSNAQTQNLNITHSFVAIIITATDPQVQEQVKGRWIDNPASVCIA
jgi:hypothetical protein